ncbi:bile acid:sodium symporter family protein [Paenirhodobacter sp.]|uniref:bile acid:sodium symporter family protein n=1 Tax=Paenirhodobacter sp. TaxID=1965326 RepID=UPI003B50B72F
MQFLRRIGIDTYMLLLVAMVCAGGLLPARGQVAAGLHHLTFWAVALLFLLYGAKLDLASIRAGLMNLRLQAACLATTYALFPALGLALSVLLRPVLGPELATGLLFLSVLPSTVQSAIAFTGIAGGNVAAAICAASISNLLAVGLTPALMALLMERSGGISTDAVGRIAVQILLPFVLGQMLRPWIGAAIRRQRLLTLVVDRGSILMIVYAAFSAGTVAGIWTAIPPFTLLALGLTVAGFMALVMAAMAAGGAAAGLPMPDRRALFFCGSTKSLASGLPIATALFPPAVLGAVVLPVMLFHLGQLLVCAVIAQRAAQAQAA